MPKNIVFSRIIIKTKKKSIISGIFLIKFYTQLFLLTHFTLDPYHPYLIAELVITKWAENNFELYLPIPSSYHVITNEKRNKHRILSISPSHKPIRNNVFSAKLRIYYSCTNTFTSLIKF